MLLSKLDFEEGVIGRAEYLGRVAEMARAEKRAKTLMGYYNDSFSNCVVNKDKDEEEDRAHLLANLSYAGGGGGGGGGGEPAADAYYASKNLAPE